MRLLSPVGKNAPNHPSDVGIVQALLHRVGAYHGRIDNHCGPKTLAAITHFQSGFSHHPDGRVDVDGTTWNKLTGKVPSHPMPHKHPPTGSDPAHPPSATPQRPAPSPTVTTTWTGDSARWSQEKKLQSLDSALRPKVEAILATLREKGFQPKVFFGWRSVAVQLEIVKKGNSDVKFSFHNAQKPDGTPNAYAADIIDSRWGWEPPAEKNGFWKALGEAAKDQGLVWGGDWKKKDVAHVQNRPNGELGAAKKESGL